MMTTRNRILVATYHSYIDLSSGAAISLRDMLEALAVQGWEVRVLSGPRLDFESTKTNEDLLRDQGFVFRRYQSAHQGQSFTLYMYCSHGVDCAIWVPDDAQSDPDAHVGAAWLGTYKELLESWMPDFVMTYGGFWMTRPMLQMARNAGAKTVFYLCNFAYTNQSLFEDIDVTIVLSRFQADWYQANVGIEAHPVYPLIPRSRYRCEREPGTSYVTLVNPQPHKGAYVFAKIAEVLGRERSDIPFLVVEGRAAAKWLGRTGAELSPSNVYRMPNTPDPRDYLQVTKVMLMPSVWQESFGRVAAEAMLNGIPVIGSTRGALPEVIGDSGLLIDLPSWLSVDSHRLPERHEVAQWIASIERLWDDSAYYQEQSNLALQGAARWDEAATVKQFEQVLRRSAK